MISGYHAVYAKDYFDGIDAAKENGFDFVQFDLGVTRFFLNDLSDGELKNIRKYAEDKSVRITFHMPGDNVSLFCDYPFIRRGILDEFRYILDKANILNARHVTVHAGAYPQFKKTASKSDDSYSAYYEDVFYDNVKCLTDNCGDVLVCMENYGLNENKLRVLKTFIDDKNPIYLTLDTAKMYTAAGQLIEADYAFFDEYRSRIREIHIHDMNREFGSHQTVGTGTVDFGLFKPFYNENIYVNFEVRPVEAAKISKDNLCKIWA